MITRAVAVVMCILAAATMAADAQPTMTLAGVAFHVPSGWSHVPRDDGKLVLLAPVEEKNWRAFIYVQSVTDTLDRSLQQMLSDLIPMLKLQHAGLRALRQFEKSTQSGLRYVVLEYSYHDADTPALVTWTANVSRPGKNRILVHCYSEESLVGKYQPLFAAFLESMAPSGA